MSNRRSPGVLVAAGRRWTRSRSRYTYPSSESVSFFSRTSYHSSSSLHQTSTSPVESRRPENTRHDPVQAIRNIMRSTPHSIAVITACRETHGPLKQVDVEPSNVQNLLSPYYRDFCGAVVSSVTTVTLGPPPVFSFNLKMPSRTLSGILHHKHFGVHFLEAQDNGAYIAETFLRKSHDEAFEDLAQRGTWVGLNSKMSNPDKAILRSPRIVGPGILSYVQCRVLPEKCIVVGDHMVVIGEVMNVEIDYDHHQMITSLLYSKGTYRAHGRDLKPSVIYPKENMRERPKLLENMVLLKNELEGQRIGHENLVKHVHRDIYDQVVGSIDTSIDLVGERTYVEFCQHLLRKLPDNQQKVARLCLNHGGENRSPLSLARRAVMLEELRRLSALDPNTNHNVILTPELDQKAMNLEKLRAARHPWNFWGNRATKWSKHNPPWKFSIQRLDSDLGGEVKETSRHEVENGVNQANQPTPSLKRDALARSAAEESGGLENISEEGIEELIREASKEDLNAMKENSDGEESVAVESEGPEVDREAEPFEKDSRSPDSATR